MRPSSARVVLIRRNWRGIKITRASIREKIAAVSAAPKSGVFMTISSSSPKMRRAMTTTTKELTKKEAAMRTE